MNARRLMIAPPKKDKGSIVLSLVIHVFVIVAIASITFRYPLASLFSSLPDVNIAYLCDVDPGVYDRAVKTVETKNHQRPPLF